ncbi:MAG: hypothetical protein K0R65_521 [Crocinitomicaceae bacterium]|jgi:hypothetical protein|nr:hypothetical protein [Crocinitomicaceae bacterium]
MKSHVVKLFILTAVLFSCKKESVQSGSGGLVYRSSYEYHLEIKPAFFSDRLVLENANPYSEIMGQIATSANASTIDGKPMKFSDINITNIRLSSAFVHVSTQEAFVDDHLTDSKIVFKNLTSMTETTIATFSGFSDSEIKYTLSSDNLAEIFKSAGSGMFYIHFDFDSNAVPDNIKVYYDIFFDYDYSLKQYKK